MKKLTILALVATFALVGCNGAELRTPTGSGTSEDPIMIPYVSQIALDGQMEDWNEIGPMPMPYMTKEGKMTEVMVKMAWNESGLFGLAVVPDEEIESYANSPWEADAVEVWLDKDGNGGMATDMNDGQYAFAPAEEDAGEAKVSVPYGSGAFGQSEDLGGFSRKTDMGYVLEFRIPAKIMSPAQLEPGTVFGLDLAVDNEGQAVAQLYNDKQVDNGYANPSTWAKAKLCACGMPKDE